MIATHEHSTLDCPFDHVPSSGPFSWEGLFDFRQDFPKRASPEGERICVIGGGIAGLCASYELHKRGYRVTLLEATRRCGGRIRTHHFDDGTHGELGAMRIPISHLATLDYVERFGLQTRPFVGSNPRGFFLLGGQQGQVRFFGDSTDSVSRALRRAYPGLTLSNAELRDSPFDLLLSRIVHPVLRPLTDEERWSLFIHGGSHSKLADWEQVSLRDYVLKVLNSGLSGDDWAYIARATGLLYLEEGTFAQFVLDLVPTLGSAMVEIVGGTEQLPNAFLRRLRSQDVVLEAAVHAIRVDRNGVTVHWNQNSRERRSGRFDFVICTVPIKQLAAIDLLPQRLAGRATKYAALREVSTECLAKSLFHCSRRFWELEHKIFGGKSFTDQRIQQCYYPSDNARRERTKSGANKWIARDSEVPQHAGVFTAAYMWGDMAQQFYALDDDEARTQEVVAGVDALHGRDKDDSAKQCIVGEPKHHVWEHGFTYFRPGQQLRHQEEMRKPLRAGSGVSRLFFAGEHLGIIHGWIISGIITGLAAVRDVIEASNSATAQSGKRNVTSSD